MDDPHEGSAVERAVEVCAQRLSKAGALRWIITAEYLEGDAVEIETALNIQGTAAYMLGLGALLQIAREAEIGKQQDVMRGEEENGNSE